MDENVPQPIGEAKPINPRQAKKILKRMGAIVSVAIGGVAAFAFLLAPTRLAGASRSARLLWQNRQKEINEAIEQDRAARLKPQAALTDEKEAASRK
jgi:hypothetical protein